MFLRSVAKSTKSLERKDVKAVSSLGNMLEREIKSTEKVYFTSRCIVKQCDQTNSFLLNLFGEEVEMNVCTLFAFKTRIFDVDIENLLLESHLQDIEIIPLKCQDRILVYTADEILELRDLLSGTFAMLEMNSIIHASLRKKFF